MSKVTFWFVRHGQTEYNRLGLRCGGDLDLPLTVLGEQQAAAVASQVEGLRLDLLLTSPLLRARQTAAIIGRGIDRPVQVHPLIGERLLGTWNGLPISETELLLKARATPPGGEPEAAFFQRISAALEELRPLLGKRRTLIVSSKGVARMLDRLAHVARENGVPAQNAEVREYVLA